MASDQAVARFRDDIKIEVLIRLRKANKLIVEAHDLMFAWPADTQKETAAVAPDAA